MSFLKNKHVVIAVAVAPVLAVLAWYASDMLVGEEPQAAEAGRSYQLVEKPNCRYASGACGMKNGDMELTLTVGEGDEYRISLVLVSAVPLEGVVAAWIEAGEKEGRPRDMLPISEDRRIWSFDMAMPDPEQDRLRLVASADEALYFGDVAFRFMADPESAGD